MMNSVGSKMDVSSLHGHGHGNSSTEHSQQLKAQSATGTGRATCLQAWGRRRSRRDFI
jgi:hypothetical protein